MDGLQIKLNREFNLLIMKTSQTPALFKIVAITRFAFECQLSDIKGVKDTSQKICACYLAKKVTTVTNKTIGEFFQINPDFMEDRVNTYAVQLLIDPRMKQIHERMEKLFWELELANVRS